MSSAGFGRPSSCSLAAGWSHSRAAVCGGRCRAEGFETKFAVALLVVAGLLALTGGNAFSRTGTLEMNALMGTGPDHEDASTGTGLTGVGIFLFVSLPLFAIGGLLYGSG
jgi:hypothetical protein